MEKTLVTKGEYARRKKRSPAALSKWIKLGRISQAALVGEGNSAKIWVEQAEADLTASLDPSQQLMQLAPILPPEPTAAEPPQPRQISERELDLARRARADADKAEHDAEAARRKNEIEAGRWVNAEEAQRTFARELAKVIADTEMYFQTLARELADRHGLEWKTLVVEIRDSFRRFRADASDDARRRREAAERADQAQETEDLKAAAE